MHEMLTQLKLARIREIHQHCLDRAAESQMPYLEFLRGLLQEKLLAREDNQLRRRVKDAAFPFEKTLDDFDFHLLPELDRQVFLRYHDTALAALLVDRLLHHGEVYYLKGDSYRLRG